MIRNKKTGLRTGRAARGLAVGLVLLAGCAGPAPNQKETESLRPGMTVEEALSAMPGSPTLRRIDGLPEIAIYDYGTCAKPKDCRGPALVFVDGRYQGLGLDMETLRQPARLVTGMTRNEFGRYGRVPTRIIRNPEKVPGQEAWVYDYEMADDFRRELIVYFRDDRLVNWIDLSLGSSKPQRDMTEAEREATDALVFNLLTLLFFGHGGGGSSGSGSGQFPPLFGN